VEVVEADNLKAPDEVGMVITIAGAIPVEMMLIVTGVAAHFRGITGEGAVPRSSGDLPNQPRTV
jgi:hypothetical protein